MTLFWLGISLMKLQLSIFFNQLYELSCTNRIGWPFYKFKWLPVCFINIPCFDYINRTTMKQSINIRIDAVMGREVFFCCCCCFLFCFVLFVSFFFFFVVAMLFSTRWNKMNLFVKKCIKIFCDQCLYTELGNMQVPNQVTSQQISVQF